jgi:alkylation response protein AidB-like acyl-CoA dehydrogenase
MNFQLTDEQKQIVSTMRDLAGGRLKEHGFAHHEGGLPRDVLKLLADQGLAGITLPEEDGGQGGALIDAVLVIEALAERSAAAGDCAQALNFGAVQQVARLGTPEQKAAVLAPVLRGEQLVSVAMTEPEAGSALAELRTKATIDGDEVVLNGAKIFGTHGDSADWFCVWARFGEDRRAVGAVLVPRGAPGLDVDSSHRFMSGERYGQLYFDDCRVPRSNVLIEHDGFKRLISVFNIERLGNSARALAYGQAAFAMAVDYARERRQFGRALMEFQGLQWRFAEMKVKLDGARLLLYRAAANADAGLPSPTETAVAKLACNRAGYEVADAALQVFGAYGYEDESAVNYIYRRTRGWMIAGGTVEQLLNRIAADVFGERFPQHPPPAQQAVPDQG